MERLHDALLQETLYSATLPSGLRVFVLPRPGFRQTAATFTTHYGSINSRFIPPGQAQEVHVPDGIAHFLEHQLFAEEDGDVSEKFAKLGASVNAFTSWSITSYYFTTTANFELALDLLLGFVQKPHFTPAGVTKEQGIIEQELQMMQDMAERRSFMNLLEAMYHKHPVALEIGGTVESIRRITADDLYLCYNNFYHPSNMVVFVAGDVQPEHVLERVAAAAPGKGGRPRGEIQRVVEAEPGTVRQARITADLVVAQPIMRLGFKDLDVGYKGEALLKRELLTLVALEAVLGHGSDLYQQIYEDGLIDKRFGFDYNSDTDFGFTVLGGPTRDPDALEQRIIAGFEKALAGGLAEADFERAKKKGLGRFLSLMDGVASVAYLFQDFYFKGIDYFRLIPMAKALTLEEANSRLRDHFDPVLHATSIIYPKQ